MPKNQPKPLRPQDAMTRFDRLLSAMAPKTGSTPETPSPNRSKTRAKTTKRLQAGAKALPKVL